jgi:L-cysteine/cystine lyase
VAPLPEIVALARVHGARVVVDGSQAVGAIGVDAPALGADAYAIAGHRWLLGPEGIGGLWRVRRTVRADDDRSRLHPASVVGLARAIGWLSMFVGLEFVHRRGAAMAADAAARLAAIDGVELVTPAGSMATIVTFRVRGWPAARALEELASRTFLIARAIPSLDGIRLSPGCWTTADELERVAEAVTLLARHTPETLPPRRTLAMLGQP